MTKVKKRKLSKSELAEVRKRTKGQSEKERTEKILGKDKSKKATKKEVEEILKVLGEGSKKKAKAKSNAKAVKKDKSKSKKAVSTKEIKKAVKELDMPAILNSRHVTILVEEMTGHKLGVDNTAGSKNLRRYLRQLRQGLLKEQGMTSYQWSIKDDDDLSELAEIISHYMDKVAKQA